MSHLKVQKAVFPIAGLGTRFLPATKASPKEMLPIVDKPLIQYAVEEAYEAGIRQMIFVTGRSKRAVEDHFDTAYELESELDRANKHQLLSLVKSITPSDMQCFYVRQSRALGLGHAIGCAEQLIGNEPFAILLADDLMISKPSVLTQLMDVFSKYQASIVAIEEVPRSKTQHYGIVSGMNLDGRLIKINQIIEKPQPALAPSNLAVAGRYILMPSIFKYLQDQEQGSGGEIQLTDAIAKLLENETVYAYPFHGLRYDCGSKLGFLQATVDIAMSHKEIGTEFSSWLEKKETHSLC